MNRLVKTMLRYLFVAILLATSSYLQAQVTLGDAIAPKSFSVLELSSRTTKGGFRLPHLTTAERNALNNSNTEFQAEMGRDVTDPGSGTRPGLAMGLTIYNTDTYCIEYWDGYKWVSLCLGSASIVLSNYPPLDPLPAEGGETESMVPTEEPKCASNPPYSIVVTVGGAYADAYIVEQSTGEFRVYMQPNPTAKERVAIVKVTNNCTNEYKEFPFNQEGNIGLCNNLTTKPLLTASNNGIICGGMGNSIILAVTNPDAAATYIWMRNDNEEIGRGKFITVDRAGNYKVYAGGIGCDGNDVSDPVVVTINTAGTPPQPATINADNGAVICGGTNVTLAVTDFSSITGTVQWYKDGIKQTTEGQSFVATTAGTYVAVVSGGGCVSNPSNAIVVEVKTGTPVILKESDIEINGRTLDFGNPAFCNGGWLNMRINNTLPGYVYKWVMNGTQIGTGATCNYQLSGAAGSDVNLSIIAESGAASSCPKAVTINSTISVNAPLSANITGPNIFCNNVPGGAQLNAVSGGAGYVWRNLNTGATSNTGVVNSFGATTTGRYEVAVTTTAGCVSVTPIPHQVEMIGSPALTWTGGVLASVVGEGETVTFVVRNVGSPVTHGYTWAVTNKSGTADATFPSGSTTETTQIKFTGGGVVTLTIVGQGFCGSSAPLSVDIVVNQDRPSRPVVVIPPGTPVCGGWLFTLEEGNAGTAGTLKYYEAQYGTNFIINWNEVIGSTSGVGAKVVSGANSRYCYVPFTAASSQVTMTATCISQGLVSDPSIPRTVSGGIGTVQTYSLTGESCFDIKQTPGTDNSCGVWDQRTGAKFNVLYEYKLTGSLLPTNAGAVTWSVDDPNNLIEAIYPMGATDLSIAFHDATVNTNIIDNPVGLSATLHVTFTVMNGSCSATYSKSIVINIRDCDCCGSVTDVDGNIYRAHSFGSGGCWMIENLAVTKRPDGTTPLSFSIPVGNTNFTNARPIANGGRSWGLQYDWPVLIAGQGDDTDIITSYTAGTAESTVQGICPDGWVVPSDYDWTMLEKEIATNPTPYSSNTLVAGWNASWQTSNTWRPSSANTAGGWGQSMKTARSIPGLNYFAGGRSNTDGTGFEVLMTGRNSAGGDFTDFWTSSRQSGNSVAFIRMFGYQNSGVFRSIGIFGNRFALRCKKRD